MFIGGEDYYLYAVDADTGAGRWKVDAGTAVRGTPAVVGDTIVFYTKDGVVHAHDATSGAKQWTSTVYSSDRRPSDVVIAAADGMAFFPGPTASAVNVNDGSVAWESDAVDFPSAGVAVENGTVYLVGDSDRVYALDAATGDPQWSKRLGARTGKNTPPTVVDGTLYIESERGVLYALDAATGDTRWTYDHGGEGNIGSPAVADGTVVVGSVYKEGGVYSDSKGELHGVAADTGENRWTVSGLGALLDPPTVVDGVVHVGSFNDTFYGIDLADGTRLWSVNSGGGSVLSHAHAGERVFVGVGDGKVQQFTPAPERTTTTSSPETASDAETATATTATGRTTNAGSATTSSGSGGTKTATAADNQMKRGFFSNSMTADESVFSNVFNLTVAGFALSVAGIVQQMVRGD